MNLMNLVCAIFTLYQIAFCYFSQASEEGKTDNDNDFNPLMPGGNKKVTYTLTNLQLKAPRPSPFPPPNRHISQLKKFFEKYNCELIYAVLRYFILIVMWIQPIFSFTELVTCNLMQICSWIFSKHF